MSNFWFSTITKSSPKIKHIFLAAIFSASFVPVNTRSVAAQSNANQDIISCDLDSTSQEIINRAIASYGNETNGQNVVSNAFTLNTVNDSSQNLIVTNQGITNEEGQTLDALNAIADSLIDQFQQQGLDEASAKIASVASLSEWASLPADSNSETVAAAIKQSSQAEVGEQGATAIAEIPDSQLLTALSGLQSANLQALGLSPQEAATASQATIMPQAEGSLQAQIASTTAATINRPEAQEIVTEVQAQSAQELENIRQGEQTAIATGSLLRFRFRLDNQGANETQVKLPNVQSLTEKGITGAGEVTGVVYNLAAAEPEAKKNRNGYGNRCCYS